MDGFILGERSKAIIQILVFWQAAVIGAGLPGAALIIVWVLPAGFNLTPKAPALPALKLFNPDCASFHIPQILKSEGKCLSKLFTTRMVPAHSRKQTLLNRLPGLLQAPQ